MKKGGIGSGPQYTLDGKIPREPHSGIHIHNGMLLSQEGQKLGLKIPLKMLHTRSNSAPSRRFHGLVAILLQ